MSSPPLINTALGEMQDEQTQSNLHTNSPTLTEDVEFISAELALANNVASQYDSITNYDWVYNDHLPINFTAVEIITFLPHLYGNRWVAERFLNNGITNTQHLEIHNTHRDTTDNLWSIGQIANIYLEAMRGRYWRLLPQNPAVPMWTRRKHQIPVGWNHHVILMNDFRADDPSIYVPPVPFISLLNGVKKIPTGADAADLTRAIDYAAANHPTDANGHPTQYMFPYHLGFILDQLGSRDQVSMAQLDSFVFRRYELQIQKRRIEEQSRQVISLGLPRLILPIPSPHGPISDGHASFIAYHTSRIPMFQDSELQETETSDDQHQMLDMDAINWDGLTDPEALRIVEEFLQSQEFELHCQQDS